ncbi:ribbon-helix-helix protein, CopG family [Pelatocladus sp. BLCC-F211]
MQKLTVRFSDKEHQDLTKLSQKTERSLNDLVREAVRQYIERETAG